MRRGRAAGWIDLGFFPVGKGKKVAAAERQEGGVRNPAEEKSPDETLSQADYRHARGLDGGNRDPISHAELHSRPERLGTEPGAICST